MSEPAGSADGGEAGLVRTLSPNLLAVYALATVLGAGIYVVVGEIAATAGALAPLAFLLALVAAGFSALSYAELGARMPLSGGTSAFVDHAFGRRGLTALVGWAVIATGLVSAATIATGFAGYVTVFLPLPEWLSIPLLIGILTTIAAIGVKESAWFMAVSTAAGLVGLLIVAFVAGGNLGNYPAQAAEALAQPGGWAAGVVFASLLAFYAFIGFEDLVTLGEEARQAPTALPRAILIALGVSLVFYLLTAAVVVTAVDPASLAGDGAPLVTVMEAAGRDGRIIALLSLLVIVDGALAQIVMAARVVHDLGNRRGGAPTRLAAVHPRTRTPLVATLAAGAVVILLALFFDTATLARATSLIILFVFIAANLALIRIKRAEAAPPAGVRAYPIWVPVCGIIVSAALIVGEVALRGG